MEWERKKEPVPLAVFFSTLNTHHVNGKNPKPSFSELYLSPWLLEKTSVVQMWDGKSGLHWRWPCGCFGLEHTQLWVTDAWSPVLMWPTCETRAPTILHKVHASDSLGNNSQLKNSFMKSWNTFLNRRSFSRGVGLGKRCLMKLQWALGQDHRASMVSGGLTENRKKSAPRNVRFRKCSMPWHTYSRKLVHLSHCIVSLEMSSANHYR